MSNRTFQPSVLRRFSSLAMSLSIMFGGATIASLSGFGPETLASQPNSDGQHQVWVCKYVGQPGDFETLKPGKNPIIVDVAAADDFVGADFADGQNHSKVIDLATDANTGQGETYTGSATCPVPPTPSPTTAPTAAPTATPEATAPPEGTPVPTAAPTAEPTAAPTAEPTAAPTATPEATVPPQGSPEPTAAPTATPEATVPPQGSPEPTTAPTATPEATLIPLGSPEPTARPTHSPNATVPPTDTASDLTANSSTSNPVFLFLLSLLFGSTFLIVEARRRSRSTR